MPGPQHIDEGVAGPGRLGVDETLAMKTSLLFATLALFVTACGETGPLLPDGGRPRGICSGDKPTLSVKVLDNQGNPWGEAEVQGINLGTGKSLEGTTDGAGVNRSINGDIGAGTVRVHARFGDRESPVYDVQWVCGECNCTVQPGAITLIIP